jgi:hypothetical protein
VHYLLFIFLPRLGRLKVITALTDQINVLQTLPENARTSLDESTAISVLPLVEPKRLLVQIPEKVKGLHVDVGSLDRALEQAPEVLQSVRVNVPLGVANRVVDDLVNVILIHADVGAERIGMQFRAFQNVLAHVALYLMIASGLQHLQFDPRRFSSCRALQQPLDGRLELPARNVLLLAGMLELVPTADKGFVGFDAPGHFLERTFLHGQTDTVKHEPTRLLGDTKGTANLVGANPVLRIDDEPDSREPLAQGQWAIAKDRADFYRELFFTILAVAYHALAGKRTNIRRAAMSALWLSVWPQNLGQKIVSVLRIGKKRDGFLKGFGSGFLFHATNIAQRGLGVKYIITLSKDDLPPSPFIRFFRLAS